MNRFFVDSNQIMDDKIEIIGNDCNHIIKVLRMEVGNKLEIACKAYLYICQIVSLDKDKVSLNILSKEKGKGESNLEINLFQALPKSDKMDLIIQKATEIGVKAIYPIKTTRTIVKLDDKKAEKRLGRWRNIAMESAKQCKRDEIPRVENILSFEDLLNLLSGRKNILIPYELEEELGLSKFINNYSDGEIHIIIGPEGGFDEEEVRKIKEIGGLSLSLGSRILRTETAGLVVSSILQYELGDLGEKNI